VLAAVNFDRQSTLRAVEVEDKRSKLMLSAKLRSSDLSTPEHHPEESLRVRLATT
jgi:hypothetical protein